MHITLDEITEIHLQETMAWSFAVWLTGRYPTLDHTGSPIAETTLRGAMGLQSHEIAGGHVGVYVGTVADQPWIAQHFRFATSWSGLEICHRCLAENQPGAFDFTAGKVLPERSHREYMASTAAANSPLIAVPGFHITTLRGESMHAGPLGAMPDTIGSVLIDMCDDLVFGG